MIPGKDITEILERFRGRKVLVAGDLVLDHYLQGTVSRISPEAPVPVVSLGGNSEKWIPGGAANVALNILSLGGLPSIAGVVGDDGSGEKLNGLLAESGVDVSAVVTDPSRPTTLKTRVMGKNQQLLRIDREEIRDVSKEVRGELIRRMNSLLKTTDAVILEDYDKGVLTPELIGTLMKAAAGMSVPVSVDPKFMHFWDFPGCRVFKPNRHEASAALGQPVDSVEEAFSAAGAILKRTGSDSILLTMGAGGSVLHETRRSPEHIPAVARHVFDVSGAGDSVIAVMGLASCCDIELRDAARTANLAAAAVCSEPGVYAVRPGDIQREARRFE